MMDQRLHVRVDARRERQLSERCADDGAAQIPTRNRVEVTTLLIEKRQDKFVNQSESERHGRHTVPKVSHQIGSARSASKCSFFEHAGILGVPTPAAPSQSMVKGYSRAGMAYYAPGRVQVVGWAADGTSRCDQTLREPHLAATPSGLLADVEARCQ